MEETATATCTFRRHANGIVHAVMRRGCDMRLEDAKENVAAIFELGGRSRSPVLVDMRGVRSQTREARAYFAGPEAEKATLAVALLIGSPVSRVLASFFMHLIPQRIPTAIFTDESAAMKWLLERRA
jgi:hypothetical protein